jgi:hypothetical protein
MQGLIFEKVFATIFIARVTQLFEKNQLGTTGLPVRSSPSTLPHTTRKSTHAMKTIPDPNTSFCDHTATRPIP